MEYVFAADNEQFCKLNEILRGIARESERVARKATADIFDVFPPEIREALAPLEMAYRLPHLFVAGQFPLYEATHRLMEMAEDLDCTVKLGEMLGVFKRPEGGKRAD